MPKQAVFTMKLESELRDAFIAAAEAAHRPASQLVRELMRNFIQQQREAADYDEFVRRKVDIARTSIKAGHSRSNEDVAADFAARRAAVLNSGET